MPPVSRASRRMSSVGVGEIPVLLGDAGRIENEAARAQKLGLPRIRHLQRAAQNVNDVIVNPSVAAEGDSLTAVGILDAAAIHLQEAAAFQIGCVLNVSVMVVHDITSALLYHRQEFCPYF